MNASVNLILLNIYLFTFVIFCERTDGCIFGWCYNVSFSFLFFCMLISKENFQARYGELRTAS